MTDKFYESWTLIPTICQSTAKLHVNLTFSTKQTNHWITYTINTDLHSYMAGILKTLKARRSSSNWLMIIVQCCSGYRNRLHHPGFIYGRLTACFWKRTPCRLGASAPSWVLSGLRPGDQGTWLIKIYCKLKLSVSSSNLKDWQVRNGIWSKKCQSSTSSSPHRST